MGVRVRLADGAERTTAGALDLEIGLVDRVVAPLDQDARLRQCDRPQLGRRDDSTLAAAAEAVEIKAAEDALAEAFEDPDRTTPTGDGVSPASC